MASYANTEPSNGRGPGPEMRAEVLALYASLDSEECDEATVWTRIVGAITIVAVSAAGWAVIGSLLSRIFR